MKQGFWARATARTAVNDAVFFIEQNSKKGRNTEAVAALARILIYAHNYSDNLFDIADFYDLDEKRQKVAWDLLRACVDGFELSTLPHNQDAFQVIVNYDWKTPGKCNGFDWV